MLRGNYYIFFILIGFNLILNAQRKDLSGTLIADDDVEGIHILNRTALKYAISGENGRFNILAKTNDTLFVSGLKYQNKRVVISRSMYETGSISIALIEKINELNEVVVGKIFTGSLESDLENLEAKTEIDFYDLGIPGYIGKPLTQNERKLHDADAGSWGYLGLGFGVNFHKLLNTVSGRTKKLKEIVALEKRGKCIDRLRRNYETIIFETNNLPDTLKNEYFFFCEEDPEFEEHCNSNNDLTAIEFLKEKLIAYKKNLNSTKKE
ncbi:MAG: hypothetical protein HKN40_01105 [Winogradskyella sp.]|uniref:hypothetical protein n=1 Tax=Winogradskyella sp. TaxID=1883156 RepID=UPI00179E7649|nr:hypothetical protein [Winogradskyella sp.]